MKHVTMDYHMFCLRNNVLAVLCRRLYDVLFQGCFADNNMWKFKQIKDLYLRIVAPRNLFIEFIHEVRSATRLPFDRTWEVFAVC